MAIGTLAGYATTNNSNNTDVGYNAEEFNPAGSGNTAFGVNTLIGMGGNFTGTTITNSATVVVTSSAFPSVSNGYIVVDQGLAIPARDGIASFCGPSAGSCATLTGTCPQIAPACTITLNTAATLTKATSENMKWYSRSGGNNNTVTGDNAMGAGALTTPAGNAAFGNGAIGQATSVAFDAAFGFQSLVIATTGSYNSGYGALTLSALTTGINNTALGYQAGAAIVTSQNNTVLGFQCGGTNMTGSYNVAIGVNANCDTLNLADSETFTLWLGGTSPIIRTTGGAVAATSVTMFNGKVALTPASPADNATCTAGQIAVDAAFVYVCTATNTWMRAALSSY
jgi:hypothetical protein